TPRNEAQASPRAWRERAARSIIANLLALRRARSTIAEFTAPRRRATRRVGSRATAIARRLRGYHGFPGARGARSWSRDAEVRRQPFADVRRAAVHAALRGRCARRFPSGRVPVSVRVSGGRDRGRASRQRTAAGALQCAARGPGGRRPRHRRPARARGRIPCRCRARDRLRGGARMPEAAPDGRGRERRGATRAPSRDLRDEPALGRAAAGPRGHHRADRADQYPRRAWLPARPAGRCARDRRRGRRAEPRGADGPVSLPDRRGRPGDEDPTLPVRRRTRPDRRGARATRTRRRRAELSVPVRAHRRARLRRLGRLRVPAARRDARRARMDGALALTAGYAAVSRARSRARPAIRQNNGFAGALPMAAVYHSNLRSLPLLSRGKVRDNYAVGDDRLL